MHARSVLCLMFAFILFIPTMSGAAEVQIRGKVIQTQGHVSPNCRQLQVKRNDNGQIVILRLGNYTTETSISAVSLTAVATGLDVLIDYDPAVTGSCGTEPVVQWIAINAPGF